MESLLCAIILLSNILFSSQWSSLYTITTPTVQVYKKGFSVSIPHEEGVELFAFHGNINKPIEDLEAGQISKDILKSNRSKWIFTDKNTRLKSGDVIYFWIFVIRNHIGYIYDNGVYQVKEITSTPPESADPDSSTIDPRMFPELEVPKSDCGCEVVRNLANTVNDLNKENERIRELAKILKELVESDQYLSRTLKFEGSFANYDNDLHTTQNIVKDYLKLSVPIVNVTRNSPRSITFKVASLADKIKIIRAAKIALTSSEIKLVYN